MVRADRNYPDLWFGLPGKLIKLPFPRDGYDKPYERQTFDFLTGSGNHAVSSLSTGSRLFNLNWKALHVDTFSKLDQYRIGANGAGPWVFIDPSMPNLLPPNVGAAGGLYNNVTTFISDGAGNGTISASNDSTFFHRFTAARSVRWRFSTTPVTNPTVGVSALYRSWAGTPCVPGLSYAWSSWVTVDGVTETNATMNVKLAWYTSTGVFISEVTSGDTSITAWTRLSAVGVAPVNAAYMKPTWNLLGSSVANGSTLYMDEPVLEQDTVVNDWAASTGVRPVEIVNLTDTVPNFAARFRQGIQMQLRELAR